ncbi:hypothetical protein [Bradyrhizobium viridifuturi]|uniref:hypothetical protein n=1 Tax=Bradyrhizobium viridifuturi TaxID=1654716 RepID=UPI000FE1434C|nr:hypothetical protein [Bradyrhizobium viridifuturi]
MVHLMSHPRGRELVPRAAIDVCCYLNTSRASECALRADYRALFKIAPFDGSNRDPATPDLIRVLASPTMFQNGDAIFLRRAA